MRRRPALAVAATGLGSLLLLAPAAQGQDSVGPGWTQSSTTVSGTSVAGRMQRDGYYLSSQGFQPYQVTVSASVGRPSGLADACAVPPVASLGSELSRVDFSHTFDFECNGTYPVTVVGTANANGGSATFVRSMTVAMPAPAVTGVEAARTSTGVTVTWDDMTATAKDLTGYEVHRKAGDGKFTRLAEIDDPATISYADGDLPAGETDLSYRVISLRAGTGASPYTDDSETSIDTTDPPTAPSGPADPGDPGGPSGSGGDPTQPGTSGGTSGGTGGSSGGRPASGRVQVPRLGITGTFLPPLLQPRVSPVRSTTPTTVDDGYQDALPYEAGEDPSLEGDESASMVLETAAGRGLAIPIATGLVLAVWALHLRYLARAATPTR